MHRYLIKRKPEETGERSGDESAECEPSTSQIVDSTAPKAAKQSKQTPGKFRPYQESFLTVGFTFSGSEDEPLPQCVLCGQVLANESMKFNKLKRHLETKHADASGKPLSYFERSLTSLKQQKTEISKSTKLNVKALKSSYLVSQLIAKSKKAHTIGEQLILPAVVAVCETMCNAETVREMKKIPLSNDTVKRRIDDMATNIEQQVIERIKASPMYALQLDESTDVSAAALLLVFVRFIFEGAFHEELLFCKSLSERTRGVDIFEQVNNYLNSVDILWEKCFGVCSDGAANMTGKHSGFAAKVKEVAPEVKATHCVIHREALAAKKLQPELNEVLIAAVKLVNSIKSKPLSERLFASLCRDMGSDHEHLLFHTEVRWLSRGNVLRRLFELREELKAFLLADSPHADNIGNVEWLAKLAYLADIFEKLNVLNLSLQGKDKTILEVSDKVMGFVKKLRLWHQCAENDNNFEMFPLYDNFCIHSAVEKDQFKSQILQHLSLLSDQFEKYFGEFSSNEYDWIRNPFEQGQQNAETLTFVEREELAELTGSKALEQQFRILPLPAFWLSLDHEYPNLSTHAAKVLIGFPTTYLCEVTFSAVTMLKTKNRNRLNVENDLRVSLSKIEPQIEQLCSHKQAQPSH
jgi:hypothetical protein